MVATVSSYQPRPAVTISAVIITRNEATVIELCLDSVHDWVDEIVAVDMRSTDGTREIVRGFTERIVDQEPLPYCEPIRNAAHDLASGDWIIMLDPDERVPKQLAAELCRIAAEDAVDVVEIPRQNWCFGKAVAGSGYQRDAHLRFFRRGVIDWPSEVHSCPDVSGLRVHRLPRQEGLMLIHDTWRTTGEVLERIRRYAPAEVSVLKSRNTGFTVRALLVAGWSAFSNSFLHGRGYRDGMRGLAVALLLAVYAVVIHLGLWEAQGQPTHSDASIARWGGALHGALRIVNRLRRISQLFARIGK